jgi:hypothetical protein
VSPWPGLSRIVLDTNDAESRRRLVTRLGCPGTGYSTHIRNALLSWRVSLTPFFPVSSLLLSASRMPVAPCRKSFFAVSRTVHTTFTSESNHSRRKPLMTVLMYLYMSGMVYLVQISCPAPQLLIRGQDRMPINVSGDAADAVLLDSWSWF